MILLGWARRFLATVDRPIPRYGTDEWAALAHGDPRRLAAVVLAAEMWRDHCTAERTAELLAADLAERRRQYREMVRESCEDMRGPRRIGKYADGTPYRPLGAGPSYAELERRRRE